jgi:plasmid maintenance system antidote protein VapI
LPGSGPSFRHSEGSIGDIIAGKRAITADTGLRLSKFFGMSEGFWTGVQDDYDRAVAKDNLATALEKITPLALHAA